jgi:hypothetical protein
VKNKVVPRKKQEEIKTKERKINPYMERKKVKDQSILIFSA